MDRRPASSSETSPTPRRSGFPAHQVLAPSCFHLYSRAATEAGATLTSVTVAHFRSGDAKNPGAGWPCSTTAWTAGWSRTLRTPRSTSRPTASPNDQEDTRTPYRSRRHGSRTARLRLPLARNKRHLGELSGACRDFSSERSMIRSGSGDLVAVRRGCGSGGPGLTLPCRGLLVRALHCDLIARLDPVARGRGYLAGSSRRR